MNFYYFNSEGKITNDIAAEGMIRILKFIAHFALTNLFFTGFIIV